MFGIVSTDMLISFQGEYDIYIVFSKVPYNELFQALTALCKKQVKLQYVL